MELAGDQYRFIMVLFVISQRTYPKMLLVHVLLTVAMFSVSPVSAQTKCDEEHLQRDFVNMPVRGLEYYLQLVPYRALCGHDTSEDQHFWESMIKYYECPDSAPLSKFLRFHWSSAATDNRRTAVEEARIRTPAKLTKICRQLGDLRYPETYSPEAFTDFFTGTGISPIFE